MSVHIHEITLNAHESEQLHADAGQRLTVKVGALWVTGGDRQDIVLKQGDCFDVAEDGDYVVSALANAPAIVRMRDGQCAH